MVEIFASSGGETQRIAGAAMRLETPADVYFGDATPGIAYYDKSGADLNVTLLDGSTVLLKDFFVIGADGSYSRLLRGREGAEEITGLVAPEPLLAAVGDTINQPIEASPAGEAEAEEQPRKQSEEDVAAAGEDSSFTHEQVEPGVVQITWEPAEGSQEADWGGDDGGAQGGGMGRFLMSGSNFDKIAFGGMVVASTSLLLTDWSDGDSSGASSGASARAPEAAADEAGESGAPTDAVATDEAASEAPDAEEGGADDTYLADLMDGIFGDGGEGQGEGDVLAAIAPEEDSAQGGADFSEPVEGPDGMFAEDDVTMGAAEEAGGLSDFVAMMDDDSSVLDAIVADPGADSV